MLFFIKCLNKKKSPETFQVTKHNSSQNKLFSQVMKIEKLKEIKT